MNSIVSIDSVIAARLNTHRSVCMCPSWLVESLAGIFDLESEVAKFASEPKGIRTSFTGYGADGGLSTVWSLDFSLDPKKNHTQSKRWQSSSTQKTKSHQIVDELVKTVEGYLELIFVHLSMSIYDPGHWNKFLETFVLSYPFVKELLIRYYLGVSSGDIEPSEKITSILDSFYFCFDLQYHDYQTNFAPMRWYSLFPGKAEGQFSKNYQVLDFVPYVEYKSFEKRVGLFFRLPTEEESRKRTFDYFQKELRPEIEKITRPVQFALDHPVSHSGRMSDSKVNLGMMTTYPISTILIRICKLLSETTRMCHYQYPVAWKKTVSSIEWKK